MENYALISSSSSSSPKLLLLGSSSSNFNANRSISQRHYIPRRNRTRFLVVARSSNNPRIEALASISSSTATGTGTSSSVGVRPDIYVPPPSSYTGGPLLWIGVGVGLSAVFSWAASALKKHFMQQAFKTMMGQMSSDKSPFNNNAFSNTAFPPGSPFSFPAPSTSSPATSPSPVASQPVVTVDVPATKVDTTPASGVNSKTEKKEPNRYAFVDVSPEEVIHQNHFKSSDESKDMGSNRDIQTKAEVPENGAATKRDTSAYNEQSNSSRKTGSGLSVEALEKMMEDPTVQKMVFPHLPEEMRNPSTFKWMLQNPQYRQQLEDMLNNMGGSGEWDNKMMDSLKNFDLSSPEVKQQFDEIGLTPEEVISKIMANPEIAVAFQNPRVQAAIMDCSQNPLSIAKYQNDKEVMDVFNKISELFPGVAGS
ncbi:hypothetical protein ACHQM5_017540 [Ranunculus cassubicifolius]